MTKEKYRENWSRPLAIIIKGRPDPLKLFWEYKAKSTGGVSVATPEWRDDRVPLIVAAGQPRHHTASLATARPAH
ncbi:hypothetical protein F5141DRAFT_1109484 [Pisolithus sp. B1]|nr:hypothetical protein F5141DRAFT_1109484 [Pisolithus sp. B1]